MLSIKQENFVLAYIETGNASEAYRTAGYSKGMSEKSVNEAATRLLKNSKVIARFDELRKPVIEQAQLTLKTHLDKLAELRDKADASEKWQAAIQAEVARGKASGLYVEKQEVKHSGVIDSKHTIDTEKLTDEQLRAIANIPIKT